MRSALVRFARSRGGLASIEFGLVLPVMLLFMAGIVELGRAFQTYVAVNHLASRYAISWTDCYDVPAGTCQTELGLYDTTAALQNIAPQLDPSKITLRMFQATMAGAPIVTYSYVSSGNAQPTAAETTAATTSIGTGNVGVIVTVQYQFSLLLFGQALTQYFHVFPQTSWTISYTVAQRKT